MVTATATARDPRELIVRSALEEIADPEIPAISVVELGVIGEVRFVPRPEGGERLTVELLPTFVGCPAIDVMREQITERLRALDVADDVEVEISFAEPWTSDRITPEGRAKLRASGFAPPALIGPTFTGEELQMLLPVAECPYCGSRNTTLENSFGPTLCRAIYHCADCRQPFEQFKTL
ncbi:MAG TPA: 1,2-phenylacetyl-CoA epoxidase subunit PaaD [candidate division Zixibacteria bacterium]|nr:1,2-phenylacetyl-CoA epoxidase subunit PaaD [candidate division Zixibacteria bacterium]